MKSKLVANITPGEILVEEFLKPMGLTQYRLALDIGVPPRRINEIGGRSRQTRRYGLAGFSGCRRSSG